MDLALNNLQKLICHKTQTNKAEPLYRLRGNISPLWGNVCFVSNEELNTFHQLKLKCKVWVYE